MKKLVSRKGNDIIFYPKQLLNIIGLFFLLFGFANAIGIGFLFEFDFIMMGSLFIASVLFSLPFFFLASKKIIIDTSRKEVRASNWLKTSHLAHFKEIDHIKEINDLIMGLDANASSFVLMKKNDRHGDGIKLNWGTRKTSKQYQVLREEIIQLQKLFTDEF